jgi:hypothetical protein
MASSAANKNAAPLKNAQNDLYAQAEDIAGTPYTAYTGQRVADLSANQQQGVQQAAESSGPGSEAAQYIDKAGQQADFIAGNQWNSATAAKYMNPYTQNVTDLALNKENQSYAASVNANNANATTSGAFGGDRAALTNAATTAGHEYNQGALEAEGQASAYDNATKTWEADNSRANTAASDYATAGNDITNMNQQQIQNLMATGGAQQAVSQMKLDTGYNNYLDQRSWAQNQLQSLESAAGRTPTSATVMPQNYAAALTGAGSALAGYFGKSNTSNNTTTTPYAGSSQDIGEAGNAAIDDPNYFSAGGTDSSTIDGGGSALTDDSYFSVPSTGAPS